VATPGRWVLLAYRLPREPSTPRIAIWRRLKRLGVAKLGDGLVALPLDSRNREQLEWAAEEIDEAGGETSIWLADPASAAQERELAARMARAIAAQYAEVTKEAGAAGGKRVPARRTLLRLRRELGRIRRRDYFPPPERDEAHRAVEGLTERIEEAAA
jgi:Protein ChrB, N-terminal